MMLRIEKKSTGYEPSVILATAHLVGKTETTIEAATAALRQLAADVIDRRVRSIERRIKKSAMALGEQVDATINHSR